MGKKQHGLSKIQHGLSKMARQPKFSSPFESESADNGRVGSFLGVGSVEHGRISWCGMNRLPVLHSLVVAPRPIHGGCLVSPSKF